MGWRAYKTFQPAVSQSRDTATFLEVCVARWVGALGITRLYLVTPLIPNNYLILVEEDNKGTDIEEGV
jgi:hypothetical protein